MSVGACIYCGQIGAIEVGNQEAALKIATKLCDCKEAREARRQEEMDEEDAEYRKTAIERAGVRTFFWTSNGHP